MPNGVWSRTIHNMTAKVAADGVEVSLRRVATFLLAIFLMLSGMPSTVAADPADNAVTETKGTATALNSSQWAPRNEWPAVPAPATAQQTSGGGAPAPLPPEWRLNKSANFDVMVGIANGNVYGINKTGNKLVAVDAATGSLEASLTFTAVKPTTGAISQEQGLLVLVVQNKTEYNPEILAIDIDTGDLQWQQSLKRVPSRPPVIGENRVYIRATPTGSSYVAAFDRTTGKRQWRALTPYRYRGIFEVTPTDKRVYVIHDSQETSQTVHALDPETGEMLWKRDFGDNVSRREPVVANGRVYFATMDGAFNAENIERLYALDAATGQTDWSLTRRKMSYWYATPKTIANGSVYIIDNGSVEARDADTGSIRWRTKLPGENGGDLGQRSAELILGVDDHIYVVHTSGDGDGSGVKAAVLDTNSGKMVGRYTLANAPKFPGSYRDDPTYRPANIRFKDHSVFLRKNRSLDRPRWRRYTLEKAGSLTTLAGADATFNVSEVNRAIQLWKQGKPLPGTSQPLTISQLHRIMRLWDAGVTVSSESEVETVGDDDGLSRSREKTGIPVAGSLYTFSDAGDDANTTTVYSTANPDGVKTSPHKTDSDGDGLSDSDEIGANITKNGKTYFRLKSDPTDKNTDDTGLPDGREKEIRSNPTVPEELTTQVTVPVIAKCEPEVKRPQRCAATYDGEYRIATQDEYDHPGNKPAWLSEIDTSDDSDAAVYYLIRTTVRIHAKGPIVPHRDLPRNVKLRVTSPHSKVVAEGPDKNSLNPGGTVGLFAKQLSEQKSSRTSDRVATKTVYLVVKSTHGQVAQNLGRFEVQLGLPKKSIFLREEEIVKKRGAFAFVRYNSDNGFRADNVVIGTTKQAARDMVREASQKLGTRLAAAIIPTGGSLAGRVAGLKGELIVEGTYFIAGRWDSISKDPTDLVASAVGGDGGVPAYLQPDEGKPITYIGITAYWGN